MHGPETRRRAAELVAAGTSLNRAGEILGVSRSAIREWLRDPQPAHLHACPVCAGAAGPLHLGAAYAALFGYYLGDGCISKARSHFALRVSCDARYRSVISDVAAVIEAVHVGGRATLVQAPGVVVVQNAWKHWPCLLPQHGPGRKHERHLGVAAWQWRIVEAHPAEFLRGLFHSDGSRVRNWATRMVAGEKKRYDYPRWQFTSRRRSAGGAVQRWTSSTCLGDSRTTRPSRSPPAPVWRGWTSSSA